MHFQITKHTESGYGVIGDAVWFDWRLEKKDGAVAKSPRTFDTEKAARSQIAEAKKSMKGAGRCKVVSHDA